MLYLPMISFTEKYAFYIQDLNMLLTEVCVNTNFKLITTKLPFSQGQMMYKINNNLHIIFTHCMAILHN
jgi:hypothetical protein